MLILKYMFALQLISIILLLLLGLAVLIRKLHDPLRGAFFLVTLFLSAWIAAGIFANQLTELTLFWNRLTFAAALVAVFSGYLFVHIINESKRHVIFISILLLVLLMVGVTLFSDLVVAGVVSRVSGDMSSGVDIVRGGGYGIFIGSILLVGAAMVLRLVTATRKTRDPQKKNQLRVVLYGFTATLVVGLFVAFLLPTIMQSSAPSSYSYLSGFIAVGAFMYAIRRHQLFDIRFVIARAVAYLLLLLTLILLYAVAVLLAFQLLFGESSDVQMSQTVTYLVFAIFLAFTYNPLKRFFDRMTDRLFFRHSYDSQEVLLQFGKVTSGSISLDKITRNTLQLLQTHVKPDFSTIYIRPNDGEPRAFSTKKSTDNLDDAMFKDLQKMSEKVVITDFLDTSTKRIHDNLRSHDIALVVRLEVSHEILGYLVLGQKRSGDMYNTKDKSLLRAMGSELSLAIQNSLRFEEIQQFNETLQDKVDAATKRLRRANERLKQLDATKDEFVSMASHQLRTPLTSVKGYLSMVLEGDAGKLNPTQEKLLKEAFTSSERMVRLIGDFLNVSRLRTGKFMIERKPVDMAELVAGEVEQLEPTATTRDLKLVYDKPKDFPKVELDKGKIQQVVMNFIDNAIFYSKPGGEIRLELMSKKNEIIFRVKDTGIGVPSDEKRRLFTKFYRASNARKQRPDGTGIGLFMAQKVVIAHGGTIIFESTEGKGSTFGFRLPIELSEEDAKRAAEVTEMSLTE